MISAQALPDLTSLPGFGALDVVENEAGRLSGAQRRILIGYLVLQLFWFLLAMAPIGLFQIEHGVDVVGVVAFAVAGGWVWWWFGLAADVSMATVSVIQGEARPGDDGDSEGRQYWIETGGWKLPTTGQVAAQVVSGGVYRVYYLPRSKRVVSAEAIDLGPAHRSGIWED